MPKYIIQAADSFFEDSEQGQIGEVRLITALNSGEEGLAVLNSLPSRGNAFSFFGTTASSCVLRRIRRSYMERDSRRIVYQLSYDTNYGGRGGGQGQMNDKNDRRFNFSGEMVSVQRPTGWKWDSDSTDIETGQGISLGKRVVTVELEIPTGPLTHSQYLTYIGNLQHAAGKISDASFEGFAKGNVLCNGASGGTFRDGDGLLKYKFTTSFSVRIVPGQDENGWLYVLRPSGVWDKPKNGSNYLYETYNMMAFVY